MLYHHDGCVSKRVPPNPQPIIISPTQISSLGYIPRWSPKPYLAQKHPKVDSRLVSLERLRQDSVTSLSCDCTYGERTPQRLYGIGVFMHRVFTKIEVTSSLNTCLAKLHMFPHAWQVKPNHRLIERRCVRTDMGQQLGFQLWSTFQGKHQEECKQFRINPF